MEDGTRWRMVPDEAWNKMKDGTRWRNVKGWNKMEDGKNIMEEV